MSSPRSILSFSREAGGAAAVAPVCRELKRLGWPLLLLAKGPALAAFEDRGLDCIEIGEFDAAEVERLCRAELGSLPEVVFTSATSLPSLDMTERLLWRWAAERGLRSAALIDQWQNYAIRFSGNDVGERLAYLPDRIMVMDAQARQEAEEDGLPRERMAVTGQPAFDAICQEHDALAADSMALRARHGLPADRPVIVFVAERLARDFRDSLGYDEITTLAFLGDALQELSAQVGPLFLAVKLHPQNTREELEWAVGRWPDVAVRLFAREITPREIIAASDLVVGMSSVMLVESILVGKPTVSLELNSKREPQLVATRAGAVPFLREEGEARRLLARLLMDKAAREDYLDRQNLWAVHGDAVARCVEVLAQL